MGQGTWRCLDRSRRADHEHFPITVLTLLRDAMLSTQNLCIGPHRNVARCAARPAHGSVRSMTFARRPRLPTSRVTTINTN